MTLPRISVVMPTHNRAGLLPATLRALGAQTVPPGEYEVILVADGCTDATPAAVASVRPELPYALRFVEQAGAGAAAARNHGAELAAAPLILFLDDDMAPAPTLIEAHLAEHATHPGALVLGYFPIPFGPVKDDPFARPARDWWDAGFAARRKVGYRFDFRDFCTGNISLPATLFREAGGFYQRIGGAGGEDWELGYRLLRRGARFRFAADALSLHQDFNSLDRALRRSRAEGLAHAYTVQRHIELAWSFNLHRLSRLQAFPFSPLWRFVWRHPSAADVVASLLKTAVVAAQRLGLESLMYRLHRGLAGHAYWRGVHTGLGSLAAWQRLMQDAPLEPQDAVEVDIDLAAGAPMLDSTLSAGADAVRLWWRDAPVGRIAPVAGAEQFSAVQVRRAVVEGFSGALLDKAEVPGRWKPLVPQHEPTGIALDSHDFTAQCTRVAQFDLCAPEPLWTLQGFDSVQLLVTAGGRPLANVLLPLRRGTAVLSSRALVDALARRGVQLDGKPPTVLRAPPTPVSVVVCTRDRPHALRRCLDALTRIDYDHLEVIVVDGASVGTETAQAVAQTSFRYVREDQPGLDRARNRGVAEARHEIIAFLDDSAVVSPHWLAGIVTAFEDRAVSAVTGPVLPVELVFPAQRAYARYRATDQGLDRRNLTGARMDPAEKLAMPDTGVAANMAFRRQTFDRVGPFDADLDVRMPCNAGGAWDILHRILVAGLTVRYEPEAFVWHYPWREPGQLRTQMYNDGRAFGACLLKVLRTRTVPRSSAFHYALREWLGPRLALRQPQTLPYRVHARLAAAEIWGAISALCANGIAFGPKRRRQGTPALDSGLET